MLLSALVSLIINTMLYPYPEPEGKDDRISSALLIGMSAFDVLDMADLIFGDIGCVQNYGTGWQVVYYMVLGMCAILTNFYVGLEKGKDYPKWYDFLMTGLNWCFNDVLFLIIRCHVMYTQGHFYFGLIFVIKEVLSIFMRGGLFVVKINSAN